MGQLSIGVMYGVPNPDAANGDEDQNLTDRFEEAMRPFLTARSVASRSREDITRRYIPETTYESDTDLIGFWIVAGIGGTHGCLGFEETAIPLSAKAFREHPRFAKRYRNLRRRWRRFARWAATQGVTLPKPRLWIVPVEVA